MVVRDYRGHTLNCSGKLITAPIDLPDNQGVFAITSHLAKAFEKIFFQPENKCTKFMPVKFDPHISTFTYPAQKETAGRIMDADAAYLHPIMLNQLHSGLPIVDLVTGKTVAKTESQSDAQYEIRAKIQEDCEAKNSQASQEDDETNAQQSKFRTHSRAERAFERLLARPGWNPEQVQAIKSMREAPGGIVLISGPPGTGKTEVAQAISAMLDQNGFHVIVQAPQNANCTDWMRKLRKTFPRVNALRVFPGATEEDLKEVNESRVSEPYCIPLNKSKSDPTSQACRIARSRFSLKLHQWDLVIGLPLTNMLCSEFLGQAPQTWSRWPCFCECDRFRHDASTCCTRRLR